MDSKLCRYQNTVEMSFSTPPLKINFGWKNRGVEIWIKLLSKRQVFYLLTSGVGRRIQRGRECLNDAGLWIDDGWAAGLKVFITVSFFFHKTGKKKRVFFKTRFCHWNVQRNQVTGSSPSYSFFFKITCWDWVSMEKTTTGVGIKIDDG